MPNQGGLQLLPETRKSISVTVPGENRLLYIGIVFLIISALISGGMFFIVKQKDAEYTKIKQDITDISKKIDDEFTIVDNVVNISKQVQLIEKFLASHIYWTLAFARIETLVSPQFQIDFMSGDVSKGEIALTGYSPSFTSIARQMASFNSDKLITNLSIGTISVETDGKIKFPVTLTVDKANFFKFTSKANEASN